MSNKYTKSGTSGKRTDNLGYNDNFIQVRITYEAYHMLTTYMYIKYGRVKGRMPYIISDLLVKAITSEMPEIVELKKKYGSYAKTQEPAEPKNVQPQKQASTPEVEKVETPPAPKKVTRRESIYDRWVVRYTGIIRGIKDMKAMEKEAKEAKFLFYPISKDTAVVIDRFWIGKAIELGNSPKFKIGLGQAEEIARQVIQGNKSDDELSLTERLGLALYMLNRDGYVIYSSNGWTLAIPDIALAPEVSEGKTAPQSTKPEEREAEEKPTAKEEDVCKDKAVPDTKDIEFVRVGDAVEQIVYRDCVERKGYRLYMAGPEDGVVVNPEFESSLLEKVKRGEVKFSKEEVENALESYLKNRAKTLTGEDKEKMLLKLLLQEAKVTFVNGEWRVADKTQTSKAPRVKTGSMLDGVQGV